MKKRGKPVRASLSRAKVLKVALRLADKGGIESLSMRNLAKGLKVEAMSLYNYVEGKEELLDALTDVVAGEIELPVPGGDWKKAMRQRAISAHAVLQRHAWATMLFISRPNVGPNMLRYVDATIGCLREAGFSWAMADHAWGALDAFIYGFTIQQRNFPFEPEAYAGAAKQFIHLLPVARYPYLHGMSQEIIARRHDGLHNLELGLDSILDGLERMQASEVVVLPES